MRHRFVAPFRTSAKQDFIALNSRLQTPRSSVPSSMWARMQRP